jgi:hypothetical protein
MTKQLQYIGLLFILSGFCGCNSGNNKPGLQTNDNSQQMTVTAETLKQVLEAFNRHDLDSIMEYFSDDCSFDFPRGPKPYGQRFVITAMTVIGWLAIGVCRNGHSQEPQQEGLSLRFEVAIYGNLQTVKLLEKILTGKLLSSSAATHNMVLAQLERMENLSAIVCLVLK